MTRAARAALVALAGIALGGILYLYDLLHLDPEVLADRLRASGSVGPLLLIVLLVAQAVVAPIPAPPILLATGFVYGPWLGFAIGCLGLLVGAALCFLLARTYGRPFALRFVRPEQLRAVDDRIAGSTGSTFLTIVAARLFLPPLFDPVSYGCGLLRVPFPTFLAATALGEIPKVGGFTYIGSAAGSTPTWLATWIFLGPALGLLGYRWYRSRGLRTPKLHPTADQQQPSTHRSGRGDG